MNQKSEDILERATELSENDREKEAEYLLRNALMKNPGDSDYLTKLGEVQTRLCKDEEAERSFRRALECNPEHEQALCFLGRLLDQSLRTAEAESLYRKHLARYPFSHGVVDDLCRLLISEERSTEALPLAREHVAKYPSSADAYNALRYVLDILEDELSGEFDDDMDSAGSTVDFLNNLIEQLLLIDRMSQEVDTSPQLEQELADETRRITGEIQNVLSIVKSKGIRLPQEIKSKLSETKLDAKANLGFP